MDRTVLLGNEAVARGIAESGCRAAAGYPGTPSTEILEAVSRSAPGIAAQWSPNEKVALEVAYGACIAGARAVTVMKHVGLNVAGRSAVYVRAAGDCAACAFWRLSRITGGVTGRFLRRMPE